MRYTVLERKVGPGDEASMSRTVSNEICHKFGVQKETELGAWGIARGSSPFLLLRSSESKKPDPMQGEGGYARKRTKNLEQSYITWPKCRDEAYLYKGFIFKLLTTLKILKCICSKTDKKHSTDVLKFLLGLNKIPVDPVYLFQNKGQQQEQ